ncbi:hypothetical protein BCR35DRAFT_303250 [Leucosporidium creatinivorum]|uniref:F-box domain-containing protein n=1 Tax=Leucosporidium creatinivorum TaxID=106004 RepID=A0A1Y2FLD7_9BASI|nr:hypothetical protein BCR35DRAFT_303250 [Leucosporidium creatinivorum]
MVGSPSSFPPGYFDPIVPVAPQLLSLVALSEASYFADVLLEEHWWPTFCALRDVQELQIGCVGYKLDEIFPLLQQLQHLTTLSISHLDPPSPYPRNIPHFDKLTSATTLEFIAETPALRSLALPRQLRPIWTAEELAEVKAAAEEKGLCLRLE